jgi:hypothetical protein
VDNENKRKVNDADKGLPGLLDDDDKVIDSKLKEINGFVKEVAVLHDVGKKPGNAEILENGEFSQTKYDALLTIKSNYEDLAKKYPELSTDGKIDPNKINGLKTASGDSLAALTTLGVSDLKPDTLNAKLGGSKLSDITAPGTLKDLLEKVSNLEKENSKYKEIIQKTGIDPNDEGAAQKIEGLAKRPTRGELIDAVQKEKDK